MERFRTLFKQAFKYGIVGAANTLLTFAIYLALTELFGCDKKLSNLTGYVAGVANSFIWNKQWTFKQAGAWWGSGIRFLAGFIICYVLQRLLFDCLNAHLPVPHTYNFIIAMIFYNILFFLSSKYIIFKARKA
ncbi:polysaccharide synthesis protein GtrA [Bacteroidia bacterium]|nr:polysaccharide synthesis protein GtrA [Bacteroidia bacterium]